MKSIYVPPKQSIIGQLFDVSFLLVKTAFDYDGPWPAVSVWHGDHDHVVAAQNAEAILAQWMDVHRLNAQPTFQDRVDGYPRRVWTDAKGKTVLTSYTITGMGHGTPVRTAGENGACGHAGPFILETGISSSFRIAELWGLTTGKAKRNGASQIRPEPVLRKKLTVSEPLEALTGAETISSVRKTIEKALRAAGLLKSP